MNNRILIVDDHPAIVMTLKLLLASEGFDVIAEADNGADALRMAEELRPSIMILDIGIPVIGGLAVIANIVAKKLPIKTIVLTGLPPDYLAARCRSLGAHGFVSKKSDLSEMVNAIRAVRMDDEFFPDLRGPQSVYACHPNERVSLQRLSVREYRVMEQLVQGMRNKDIAEEMQLSEKTISTYKCRILEKLNLASLLDLYALAKRTGVC